MTVEEGFMMFLFSIISFATLAFVAWFIIQEVVKNDKEDKS